MKYHVKDPLTLLEALTFMFPQSSKTTLKSWLKEARVSVDGEVIKLAHFPLTKGQEVTIGTKAKFVKGGIKILYEDPHFVVIEKPSGLLTVATAFETEETAHAFLKATYRQHVHVVHRLDQETSGVMLFALTSHARDYFKKIFEKHDIERSYTAIVEGHLPKSHGTWESLLYEDENYVVHTTDNNEKGRLAITHYEVLETSKRYSGLRLKLETGRKNQIRVHCQQAGHPIAGDHKYGAQTNPLHRLCLHAHFLSFQHPVSHKTQKFHSPLPKIFLKLVPLLINTESPCIKTESG